MTINPLQLPTYAPLPQLNFAPLDKIGDAIGDYRSRSAFADSLPGILGQGGTPSAPAQAPATGAQAPTGNGLSQDQMLLLKQKADQYGVDPNYLIHTASIEGTSKNPASSASGLGQFLDGTAKQYGVNKGDDASAADGLARFTLDNQAALTKALGRTPTPGELYLAHQQGAQGAINLLSHPDAPAVAVVGPEAVVNNGGNPQMTAAQFAAKWTAPFGQPGSTATAFAGDPSQVPMPSTQPQQVASLPPASGQPVASNVPPAPVPAGIPASAPSAAPAAPSLAGAQFGGYPITPGNIQQLQSMIRAGGRSEQIAMALVQKLIVPPTPLVLHEGDIARNPITGAVIGMGNPKAITQAPGASIGFVTQGPDGKPTVTTAGGNTNGTLSEDGIALQGKRALNGDFSVFSSNRGAIGQLNNDAIVNYMASHGATAQQLAAAKASFEAQIKGQESFGAGTHGDQVRTFNVVADHLALYRDLANALENRASAPQVWNQIANKFQEELGYAPPTNLNSIKQLVNGEIVKAITASSGALGDREEMGSHLSTASSPAQVAGVINDVYGPAIASQMKGLARQYKFTTKQDDFDNMLSDRAKSLMHAGEQGSTPANLPKITNRDDANTALAQAKAAIAQGAPRDVVVQRLRQMGVPPAGL